MKLWIKEVGKFFRAHSILIYCLLALPIIFYCLPFLLTGTNVTSGDVDFQFQLYEAFRRSVLEFHQFPWWDPWIAGGVPLFADAQFGLISVTSPLVLIFGTVIGVKLSLVIYLLIGFYGLLTVGRRIFKTPFVTAVLVAYAWVFSSFFAYRILGGHYTFVLFCYLPWLLYFFWHRRTDRRAWLKAGLVASLMIWSSPHYATIMSLLILGIFFVCEFCKFEKKPAERRASIWKSYKITVLFTKLEGLFWLKFIGVTLLLSGYRLFFAFSFIHDFPRLTTGWPEPYFGFGKSMLALFGEHQYGPYTPAMPATSPVSWLEASYAIGTPTLLVLLIILGVWIARRQRPAKIFSYSAYILGIVLIASYSLTQGNFSRFSPFAIARHLPVLDSMRVSVRWLALTALVCLFFILAYKLKTLRTTINILLLVAVIQLFLSSFQMMATTYNTSYPKQLRASNAPFEQQVSWGKTAALHDEHLLGATINNYGQIIAADPLVDTNAPGLSVRCDVDEDCPFVLTKNATVTYWSPNIIKLVRTGPGAIRLNMNPGSDWQVNGTYAFPQYRVTEPGRTFTIDSSDKSITLRYIPKYSIEWLVQSISS